MSDRLQHLSDADLLRFLDLELPQAEAERARRHLGVCTHCHDRRENMECTLRDLNGFYDAEKLERISSSPVARARLQQQLSAREKPARWWRRFLSGGLLPASMAATILLIVVGVAIYGERRFAGDNPAASQVAQSQSIPNRLLTPGAIRPVTLSEICSSTDEDLDPAVPASTQNAVLEEYGVSRGRAGKNYQIDYLVNPQLGGTNDIKNLWPEPEHEGVWNARAKDELEKHLHQMVCDRTVDLNVAQREIATDWVAAYRKYVRRQTPA